MSRDKGPLNKRTKRRAYSAFTFCFIMYSILIYRLVDIQVLKGEEYQTRVENQNTVKYSKNSGRGVIYDRNNKPLTDIEKKQIILVSKEALNNDPNILNLIKDATDMTEIEIYKEFQEQTSSSMIEIETKYIDENKKLKLQKNDIIVTEKTERYSKDSLLSHTIGHLKKDDNSGEMGIEKSMNDILSNSNEEYISVFKAGASGNKQGLEVLKGSIKEVDENEEDRHIKLTIDSGIQKIVEDVVDKEENPTAVVISDVDTGEILSMSSRPNFDQNNIEQYFSDNVSDDGVFINRATKAIYSPASTFKLVVLYAALENKVIDSDYTYNCTGSAQVGNGEEKLNCNKIDGHGVQTLQQALSNSCNTAFYDIASKLGKDKIMEAAKTLHLDEKVDIGIDEAYRELPENIALNLLAIGQGDLGLTPLQINQMTQIIANNGTYTPLYMYDSVVDNNMNTIKTFKSSKEEEIISPYTLTIVKEMMKDVAVEGTAKDLSELEGECGVKTGTAQLKINKQDVTNGLITGYYPADNPKYAITIVVEGTFKDGVVTNKSAVPIFKEICQKLNKK